MSAWCAEYGPQPSKRPSASIILNRLNEDVDKWGESIIPPVSVQRHRDQSCGYFAHVEGEGFCSQLCTAESFGRLSSHSGGNGRSHS